MLLLPLLLLLYVVTASAAAPIEISTRVVALALLVSAQQ
jgi:hypothetical protein